MEPEKSIFEQTTDAIEERVQYFRSTNLSAENYLLNVPANYLIRSVSEIVTPLCAYGAKI